MDGARLKLGTRWRVIGIARWGGAQLLLPVHVAQEYCHPSRSFVPIPSFKEVSFARSLKLYESQGEWYTAEYNGGRLGEKFGICRYNWEAAEAWHGQDSLISKTYAKGDADAVQALLNPLGVG